jgi:hypothetical protein
VGGARPWTWPAQSRRCLTHMNSDATPWLQRV